MATANFTPVGQSLRVRSANVIPLPANRMVTQDQLAEITTLRQQIEDLEKRLGEAQTDVRSALEIGAAVEDGLFRATLKVTERTNVSWKSVVERELGADYTRRVLAATKPDKYTNLVVTA